MPQFRLPLPFHLALCLAISGLFLNEAHAQNRTTGNRANLQASTISSSAKEKKFADQFWSYLLSNNYKHWSPAPGHSADHFSSQLTNGSGVANPHGASMKMYINRTAASNPDSLPVGSVLIMENYRTDKSLETISVMYRTAGFNPSANDWYWVNYNADGTVASEKNFNQTNNGIQQTYASARSPRKLMGRTQSCIQCHQSGGNDLAFFNNQPNRTATIPIQPIQNRVTVGRPSFSNGSPFLENNTVVNQRQFAGEFGSPGNLTKQ